MTRVLRNVFRKDPHRLTELCHLVAHTWSRLPEMVHLKS
jgi:hypothetical protein